MTSRKTTAARLIYSFLLFFFLPPLLPSEIFTNEGDWISAAEEEVGRNQSLVSSSGFHLAAAAADGALRVRVGSHCKGLDQTSLGKSGPVWSSLVYSGPAKSRQVSLVLFCLVSLNLV